MLPKTLALTFAFFLALGTLASADSIAITGTGFDGFDTSSGDFTVNGPGLSLFQSSPGGPSFIGLCNLGSLCNFTFSSANLGSFCGYCSLYSSGTFGSAVAQWFDGTITFSTPPVVWNGQSVMNLPLTISGEIKGFELNCVQGTNCTLGSQVFDLKIVGQGTGQFQIEQIDQSGQIIGASADFAGTATPVSTIPEPASLVLMSSGVAGIALARKRFLKGQSRCG